MTLAVKVALNPNTANQPPKPNEDKINVVYMLEIVALGYLSLFHNVFKSLHSQV